MTDDQQTYIYKLVWGPVTEKRPCGCIEHLTNGDFWYCDTHKPHVQCDLCGTWSIYIETVKRDGDVFMCDDKGACFRRQEMKMRAKDKD